MSVPSASPVLPSDSCVPSCPTPPSSPLDDNASDVTFRVGRSLRVRGEVRRGGVFSEVRGCGVEGVLALVRRPALYNTISRASLLVLLWCCV